MILYIIHMHNKSEVVMNINQVNLSKEKSIELENTNKTTFFNEKGEITIIKVNNKESDKTLAENFYKKPILLNDNHIVKISHYNKKDNLHSPKEDIPSKYNSKEDTEEFQYHKNGIPFANKEIVFNDFNGEEYNKIILNNGAIRKVYKNGTEIYKRKNIKKFYFKNKLHREYGPAIINYNEDGSVSYEEYYINNELHREDGPAIIHYYDNGSIESEEYYFNSQRHREDGPAFIKYYKNGSIQLEEYYINGKLHRENGSAISSYYENGHIAYEAYYIHGEAHKENAPAKIWYNEDDSIESEEYYIHGVEENPNN